MLQARILCCSIMRGHIWLPLYPYLARACCLHMIHEDSLLLSNWMYLLTEKSTLCASCCKTPSILVKEWAVGHYFQKALSRGFFN